MMDIAQIQAFFFKAMIEGWAGGGKKIKISEMPGYKAIPFRDGDFYLLDYYCVTPLSSKSAGTTTIWYRDVPTWVMNFGGFYEERAIAFLKRALRTTYEAHQFIGGRGPLEFTDGSLVYVNQPRLNDFEKFDGREHIFDAESGTLLGYHEYWGLGLFG